MTEPLLVDCTVQCTMLIAKSSAIFNAETKQFQRYLLSRDVHWTELRSDPLETDGFVIGGDMLINMEAVLIGVKQCPACPSCTAELLTEVGFDGKKLQLLKLLLELTCS